MAELTVYTIDYDGLDVASSYVAAAASQEFENDGRTFVHVKNTNVATRTITLAKTGNYVGHTLAATVITIGANTGDQMIGPFPKGIYNAADGNIDITWSDTADVTIGVFKLP